MAMHGREEEQSVIQKIVKGCKAWDRKSQKELYRLYYAYGMSITRRYSSTEEQAISILNDSFMKVFQNFNSYDSGRSFKPWLRQILVNTAVNHFKTTQNRHQLVSFEASEEAARTDETILSHLSYMEILEMVQELPPASRTVFNLHVIEGYTHNEIAEMLGLAEGTSKSNLARARKLLQNKVELSNREVKSHGQE